ncbi:hypothetical protein F7R97_12870 [Acinetobacter baumannii]|uniref:hypothetical protein n=1 Tax=Acinetobacter baumannii TaxID=470 RepID=UPI0015B85441|nr:hypothetical protein [Acinetobacter baumannii]MDC4641656.1 hypothetical protein [Acinetobacter baumannii]QLF07397.1 hypothetical protein F7R97_12870 [Acinetobacter baumannii]
MQIFFTIFGGPHDGYRFSLGIPMDCIHLIEHSPEAAVRRCEKPLYRERVKTVQYAKRRMFVKKYGKVFFKDVYAFNEYDFREALKKFRHYFNPVYKKQDHLRVVF